MAEKKKKFIPDNMEEEDRAFFENAMKDPEIRKKIEADLKRRKDLADELTKKKVKAAQK